MGHRDALAGERAGEGVGTLFFPGCSLMNDAPRIMDAVLDDLRTVDPACGISLLCCGKILEFEPDGAVVREKHERLLVERLVDRGVRRVVAACPNCVRELREALARYGGSAGANVEVVALPEALLACGKRVDEAAIRTLPGAHVCPDGSPVRLAVHDSCPDRNQGAFAEATRTLLPAGALVETAYSRERSICCGSVAAACGDGEAARKAARLHADEATQAGAQALVTSCMSCAQQLSLGQDALPALHYLEALYGERIDWRALPSPTPLRFLFEELHGRRSYEKAPR